MTKSYDIEHPTEREQENAERIANAKQCAEEAHHWIAEDDQRAIAHALTGLLEIAILRADVRSYEPPF